MTTTRYALIDIHSGFVWGVTDASDPVSACRAIDAGIGTHTPRTYEARGPYSRADQNGEGGYRVHAAPAGFNVDDGQDEEQIAAVEAMPLTAIVIFREAGE